MHVSGWITNSINEITGMVSLNLCEEKSGHTILTDYLLTCPTTYIDKLTGSNISLAGFIVGQSKTEPNDSDKIDICLKLKKIFIS